MLPQAHDFQINDSVLYSANTVSISLFKVPLFKTMAYCRSILMTIGDLKPR